MVDEVLQVKLSRKQKQKNYSKYTYTPFPRDLSELALLSAVDYDSVQFCSRKKYRYAIRSSQFVLHIFLLFFTPV